MSDKVIFIGCDAENNLHLGFNGDFRKKTYQDHPDDYTTFEFSGLSSMLTGGKEACRHDLTAEHLKDLLGELAPGQMVVCQIKPIATIDVNSPSELEFLKKIAENNFINTEKK